MSFYQRVWYNLHRIMLFGDKPARTLLAYKRQNAVKFFFFAWHLFYGLAIGGWLNHFLFPSARQAGRAMVVGALLSILLMILFIPAAGQFIPFDKQERKRRLMTRDAETLIISILFILSIVIGYWLFIISLR